MITYCILSYLLFKHVFLRIAESNKLNSLSKLITVKLYINFVLSCMLTLAVINVIHKKHLVLMLMPVCLSMMLSIFDSMLVYPYVVKCRKLTCSRFQYFRQITGECFMLHLSWIAAVILSYVNGSRFAGNIWFLGYFLFWLVFDYFSAFLRKKTMYCQKLDYIKYPFFKKFDVPKGYKIYVYDGKTRKMANAMVDSHLFGGNIYFSDYLLENLSFEEIRTIYYHELGHIKYKHIIIRNGLLILIMPLYTL